MSAIILYGSHTKLSNAHKPVHHSAPYCKGPYYVRIEYVNHDLNEALDKAKPRKGETVLNTVPYEPSRSLDQAGIHYSFEEPEE